MFMRVPWPICWTGQLSVQGKKAAGVDSSRWVIDSGLTSCMVTFAIKGNLFFSLQLLIES